MQRSKELADRQNDLIRAIYQAGAGMTSVSEALQALAVQTSSDKAFWGCFDLGRGVGEIVDGYNADPAWVSRYNHVVSGQNVWMRKRNYFKAEGVVWRGARIVPMHELTQSEFYEQILAPQAIHHTLHLVVAVEGDTIAHILLTRRRSELDYGKSELEIARSFAVHARHALDIRRALARTRMVQAVLTDVVADTALGVAVLDPPFIIYASETCQAMLASLGADSASNGDD